MESFTYRGNVVHNSGRSDQEVTPRIGLAYGVMDSLITSICGGVGAYAGGQSSASSSRLCSLSYCMAVRHEHLERRLNVFGTKCLRRIMGYRWNDFVSNQRLLLESESRPVTSIVREPQLRLYRHVGRLSDVDPAHRVLFLRDNPGWKSQRELPRNSWLGKVN